MDIIVIMIVSNDPVSIVVRKYLSPLMFLANKAQ